MIRSLLPGILVCVAITISAVLLQGVEVYAVGQPYLEALVLAILLGVAIRTIWAPGPRWQPGIHFSGKFVLELAIVMLGASVSVGTIVALGPILIVGIACIVAVALG
ncbi:MAG: putative sulfate exporter family transporter, partial [Bradyrhizobium sp.]